ncbi:MAG: methyltransferase domain-containing protein [Dehalococcoidia bacterium]
MDDTDRVAAGYDAVYGAMSDSPTFHKIWRTHATGEDYPAGFEHISFLTLAEMQTMAAALNLRDGDTLVDLACGMAGPGLWIARGAGAGLVGVDISSVALAGARERAASLQPAPVARFTQGSFAQTGLDAGSAAAAISVDALQYAPDKRAALHEIARILRPGGRLAFACFELEPERVAGVPVLGMDPVADYSPLLEQAGFDVVSCAETAGWRVRLTQAYQAIVDAKAELTSEMGEAAYTALAGEVTLTLQLQPYRQRVFVSAQKR